MTSLFNSLNSTYSQLNYFSKSLYQAQNSRKWSHRAIDYLQKSVAYAEADTISAESMLAEMKDAPEFRNVSDILNKEFDYYASGNVIHIQAYTLYSSNLFIAAAEKDGIGYKMGIREGDTLIAFNDEQLTDFYRFLSLLQDNQCSHASITVKRDGKTLVIKTKIPDFNPVTN